MKHSTKKRWNAVSAIAAGVALIATGCSSDNSDSIGGEVDLSVLGTQNQASGEPIEIVLATTGPKAAAFTHEGEAATAAVSYLNEYLGGINGRPIKLTICEDELQVSLARACANKAVGSDAVAVVSGAPSSPDPVAGVTSPAGLPFVVFAGGGQQTISLPNTYVLANSLAGLIGVPAFYAKDKGFQKVAVLAIDAPIATAPLKALGPAVFAKAGVQMDLVAVPPGTADMTPQIQAAEKNGNQLFQIIGDAAFCTSALKAMRTLNIDKPVTTVSACLGGADAASQIPGGYEGINVAISHSPNTKDEDYKIFHAALTKYSAGVGDDGASAYMAILALQRTLNGMQGAIDRTTVAARLSAMQEPQVLPLFGGATFQCGTKPVAIAPNICSAAALVGTANEDGTISDAKTVDVSAFFTSGT